MDMDSDTADLLDLLTYDCSVTGKKRCAVNSNLTMPSPESLKQPGNDSMLVRSMIAFLKVCDPISCMPCTVYFLRSLEDTSGLEIFRVYELQVSQNRGG